MKFLLIGHSVEDHIYYKNEHTIKPGGIYYSAAALNFIKETNDEIYLCTSYKKAGDLFTNLYEKLNPEYFNYTGIIPKVRLNIYDNKEREEIYENITGELFLDTSDLNKFDGIIVNMITGFDLTLDQIKEIRKNYNGLIYYDVHTFSRGLDKDMRRTFRQIPEFDKWAEHIDILQTNSRELFTLAGFKDKYDIIRFILDKGVKFFIETKGKDGAMCCSMENKQINIKEMPAVNVNTNNQVGTGDVFGAVFFYSYIKNNSVDAALKDAVIAGGYAATYKNINEMKNLRKDVFSRHN
ncbi:MAG TPA: PfkB family carbohydrate kinase [Ignavibacteriaceae bacterium]|nr:PfkB family carbohydrate kinase [Ignavibacteriaceae bacterium]